MRRTAAVCRGTDVAAHRQSITSPSASIAEYQGRLAAHALARQKFDNEAVARGPDLSPGQCRCRGTSPGQARAFRAPCALSIPSMSLAVTASPGCIALPFPRYALATNARLAPADLSVTLEPDGRADKLGLVVPGSATNGVKACIAPRQTCHLGPC